MVHSRELDGTELIFGNQGALWGNAMTWWDHETGSVWSQPIGEAILGPLRGERLDLLPSTLTTWESWRRDHPETLALDAPGFRSGFRLETMAVVVELAGDSAAFRIEDIRRTVANAVVGGVPLAVVTSPIDPDVWTVFSRTLDDRVIELAYADNTLVDPATGSSFDPARGIGLSGPLAGETLDILPGFTSFEEDYFTFWPNGRVWEP